MTKQFHSYDGNTIQSSRLKYLIFRLEEVDILDYLEIS